MRTARRCAAAGLILAAAVLAVPGVVRGESPETRRWWDRMERQDLEDRLERIERRRLEIEELRELREDLEEERDRADRQERRQRWELKETWPTGRGLGDPRSPALRGDDR